MIDLVQIIGPSPSSAKIADVVERAVVDRRLAHGERLPTVRSLASSLGVSAGTVALAYRRLGDRGIVTTAGRRGTVVSLQPPLPPRPSAPPPLDVRDLARGNPDPRLLPPLGPAFRKLGAGHVLYGAPARLPELERIARERFATDGISGEIAVTSGALDGIERALVSHLRRGDGVVVEDPTWPRIADLIRALGLRPEPVAIDDRGFLPGDLERALQKRPRALIATPRGQNPTGASFDAERALALRSVVASSRSLLVIEDDYVDRVSGAPYHPLHGTTDYWVVIRSLSKTLGPDLRIALLAGDDVTISRLEGRQLLGAGWVSHLLQGLAAQLLASLATERLLARADRTYTERRDCLRKALADRGIPSLGGSGLGIWVPVAHEAETVQFLLANGWNVSAGQRYRFSAPPGIRVTTTTLERDEAKALAEAIAASQTDSASTYDG